MSDEKRQQSALARALDQGEKALAKGVKGKGIALDRRALFLKELMRTPVVGTAARRAGLTRKRVLAERDRNAEFREAWDQAVMQSVDDVEQVLVEKALDGDIQAIDRVLKAHRPERYRERHEVALVADSVIEVNLVPDAKPRK